MGAEISCGVAPSTFCHEEEQQEEKKETRGQQHGRPTLRIAMSFGSLSGEKQKLT